MPDFSVSSNKNSLYSRLMQEVSQDIIRDDILPNHNLMSSEDYRNFAQQEPANENLFFKNLPSKFSESLNRWEVFSENEPTSKYSSSHVFPLRQSFDRSEHLFFRNPRNKYSESSSKNWDFQDYRKDEGNLASKLFNANSANRDTKPWKDSRDIFLNIHELLSKMKNSLPSQSENVFEERNLIKIPNSVDRQYKFANLQETYPEEFGMSEIKHDFHILPQNLNQKITENRNFFNNLDKNSLQSWNLEQLRQAKDDFLEMYPVRDEQMIITKDDNKQINHNSYSGLIFPQDLHIWEPIKYKNSLDNWDFNLRNNPQKSAEIKQLQHAENNWLQLYSPGNDIVSFAEKDQNKEYDEKNINQKYFKDELEKDTIKIGTGDYNSYNSSQNMHIWEATQDKEFFDYLNSMFEYPDEIQKEEQLEVYSQDNKYLQDKEAHADTDQIIHVPMNSYKTFLPQYLNIFNNAKHSTQFSESPESMKHNIPDKNSVEERNAKFFDNKAVIQDAQDLILSKDIFDIKEYNTPAINTWENIKDNVQNKAPRELDSDLFDDVEDPPIELTESTPIESRVEFSTPQ
jgi:hypothetical protein